MPASRKKRRGNNLSPAASTAVPFSSLGAAMLADIELAVADIPPRNEGYTLQYKSPNELNLDCVEHGSYVFKLDHETERLVVSTPVSGTLEYFYDNLDNPDEGRWLNLRDGHDVRGLITRDLLRHAAGCTRF